MGQYIMMKKVFAFGTAMIGLTTQAHADGKSPVTPYQLTDAEYAQDFNSLASIGGEVDRSLPTGWQIDERGTSASANGYYYAGSLSGQPSNVGAVSYYGISNTADHALGGRASAELPVIHIGAIFQNNLGGTIDSLNLSYAGEQWTNGFTRATLTFEYSLDATSLDNGTWTSFSALDFLAPDTGTQPDTTLGRLATTWVDGNTAAFRQNLTGVIDGLSIADGDSFGVRWSLAYISDPFLIGSQMFDVTTNDGLAVDDFHLSASLAQNAAVPEPATWAMMIVGFGLVGGTMRRRAAKVVFA